MKTENVNALSPVRKQDPTHAKIYLNHNEIKSYLFENEASDFAVFAVCPNNKHIGYRRICDPNGEIDKINNDYYFCKRSCTSAHLWKVEGNELDSKRQVNR